MSEPTGARRYGTGGGDAYYDAVKYGGYEGTREQFGKDQAEFAKNATAVAEAKGVVEQDTEEVRSTKETFVNTTVPNAIEAVQQEGADQVQAVTQQGEESSQQVETVGTEQKDAVANEGRARVQAVEQAGTNQVQAVNDAGTTQVGNVNQAGKDQVDAVEQAGADQVQAVTDEGTTQVGNVTDEGDTQVQRVQDKGDDVLNSIPADYTALDQKVDNLNHQLTQLDNISLSLKEIPIGSAVAGWKLNNDGSFASATGWNVKQCEVTEGNVLFVKSSYVWKFETGVSTGTVGDVHVGEYEGFVTIPSTAAYIAISTPISENANHGAYLFENIVNGLLEKERLSPPLATHEELGILQDNGRFLYGETYHSIVTNQIACSEGDVFYYYGFVSKYVVTVLFYGETGNIVQAIKSIDDASGVQHLIITAPQNATGVIFTSYSTLNNTPPLVVTMSLSYRSPLAWKKWYACGDSFTYGGYGDTTHVFTSGKYVGRNMVYSYFIGNRTNCDVQNIALDGMTMATHSRDSNNFTNTSNSYNYTTITDDADYVTLYFGINDNGKGVPVGEVDDTEKTTFCGAYNFVLDNLTTRLSHGKIGIIVSNEIPQSFADATIAIAKKWGIPYLDLNYDDSVPLMSGSLRPTASQIIKDKRNAQFRISEANHHPNTIAHEYESYFIERWLLSL